MHRRTINDEQRQGLLRSVCDLGMTYSQTAVIFGLPESTVKGIVAKAFRIGRENDGRVTNGAISKLSTDHRVFLCQEVMENSTCTQSRLSLSLEETFGVSVVQSTISRAFKAENITLKTLSEVPNARNSDAVLLQRKQFAEWLNGQIGIANILFEQRIVFIDESGFNVNLHRKKGWSFKGDRAFISTASNRGGNVSCFAALSPSRGFWLTSRYGPFNQMTFLSEIQCYMDSRAGDIPEGGLIFVMDNVPFHHSLCIREYMEASGNTLIFVPPYSPFLNAIENAFSKLKLRVSERLAREDRRTANLTDIISESAINISLNDCQSYYRHIFTYIPRCLNMEVINA
jgi:transposase